MLNLLSNPVLLVMNLVAIVICTAVHEFSHAKVADHLGDPTPRIQGRVTLDPRSHIDPVGLLMFILLGFGWGKPVLTDPFNFRNPRRDSAIVALAGPAANFILAALCSVVLHLIIFFNLTAITTISYILLSPLIYISIILGIFNLLPIYPFDGFRIVGGFLSEERAHEWEQLKRYGMLFLLVLIIPIGRTSMLDSVLRPFISTIVPFFMPSL